MDASEQEQNCNDSTRTTSTSSTRTQRTCRNRRQVINVAGQYHHSYTVDMILFLLGWVVVQCNIDVQQQQTSYDAVGR